MRASRSYRSRQRLFPAWRTILFCLGVQFIIIGLAGAATPLDIIVVLDVSQNMIESDRFVVAGAHLATLELEPADRVAVISAAAIAKWHSDLTGNSIEIERAFRKATPGVTVGRSTIHLYDAALTALKRIPGTDAGRDRFLILITNQADQGSAHQPEELVQEAKEKSVVVQVFLVRDPSADMSRQATGYRNITHTDVQLAARELGSVASATGGRVSILDANGYVLRKAIAACKGEIQ